MELVKNDDPGNKIFIKEVLNDKLEDAYLSSGLKKDKKADKDNVITTKNFMCENYYDVRTFGAAL